MVECIVELSPRISSNGNPEARRLRGLDEVAWEFKQARV